jgi:predicted metal-binding membrane protein
VRALRAIRSRPTFGVELCVAAAWILLAATSSLAQGSDGSGGEPLWSDGSLWACTLGSADSAHHAAASGSERAVLGLPSLLAAAPMWALMVGAMMVPPAIPAVRHVAVNSLYWRRRQAVAEFLLAFLGIWLAFSVLVLRALDSWDAARSEWALAVAMGVAAAWQLTPLKWRALRACHRPSPLPPRGWRATLGAVRFGWRNAAACLLSCWAMMVALALVTSSMLIWMAALTALIYLEKLNLKPRAAARRAALPLAVAALGAGVLALLG